MATQQSQRLWFCVLAFVMCLPGCSGQVSAQPTQIETIIPAQAATATSPPATPTQPMPTKNPALNPTTPGLAGYPLAERGSYFIGRRNYELVDASRDNRPVDIVVWYPALLPEGENGVYPIKDGPPDPGGAPYPLILSTTKNAGIFAPYLVSHGFTWVSVNGLDTYNPWDENLLIQPRDLLFALDQVATNPPAGLEGMLDSEHAGAMGYSYDGYNALALGGARIDPEFYLAACGSGSAAPSGPVPIGSWVCPPAARWDDFVALAGEAQTSSQDGLWQPMTDERIRAIVPLAGEGWWLYGEKGLAAVKKPTLLIVGAIDFYFEEDNQILEHLGTSERALISFTGQGHMMVFEKVMVARMAHFATAFFGYHLQGKEDLAFYFSEAFVQQHEDLGWGAVEGD